VSEAEHTTLFGANRALTPTDVVRTGLAGTARIVAQEALLLLALRADHRMRVLSRVVDFLALLTFISHAFGAVRRAKATSSAVVSNRALRVPE